MIGCNMIHLIRIPVRKGHLVATTTATVLILKSLIFNILASN